MTKFSHKPKRYIKRNGKISDESIQFNLILNSQIKSKICEGFFSGTSQNLPKITKPSTGTM